MTLRFLTAGESHGPRLTAIIEGLPAGLELSTEAIDADLRRRQSGYGRGKRMEIETDRVEITAGLIGGRTTGAPLALTVENRDWPNWKDKAIPPWTAPRPGHADLPGALKYGLDDMRLIAERASARETTMRVAVGAACRALLAACGIHIGSYVLQIGPVRASIGSDELEENLWRRAEASAVRCPVVSVAEAMCREIDAAAQIGETLGGVFTVSAIGVPPGLGSHVHWDRRLDARIAAALMSIPAVKGVEIGPAFENAGLYGTQVHDALFIDPTAPMNEASQIEIYRRSNRAGGIEGGMSNGEPIIVHAAMKPIPTTHRPQPTVDLRTGAPVDSEYRRSDVCAVPAAAIVGEAMLAWILTDALLEKTGGDSLAEVRENLDHYVSSRRAIIHHLRSGE